MFVGHDPITGVSLIVTVNEQLDDPQELDAVQVTVEIPVGKFDPDAGTHATLADGVPLAVGSIQVATWLSH